MLSEISRQCVRALIKRISPSQERCIELCVGAGGAEVSFWKKLTEKNKSICKWETARFTTNIAKVNNFLIYLPKSRENIFDNIYTVLPSWVEAIPNCELSLWAHGPVSQISRAHFVSQKSGVLSEKQFIIRYGSSSSLRFRMQCDNIFR